MTGTARRDTQAGTVVAFDADVGLGEIESEAGDRYRFHCVEIADGSRTIDVGASVDFAVVAKFGRYEAATIRRER
ncbi:MAG: cold shock domain-containing protein [Ilumatobacter sp.]|nr:cold shock domain-containing protein [Ilumatobacter sp.]